MGVQGLTTYIYNHSDKFLQEFELRNTRLVIDGCSLAVKLYCFQHPTTYFYGGDYDVYYEFVRQFFFKLKKCNVEAIVILDGGMDTKKLKTHYKRAEDKIIKLKKLNSKMLNNSNILFPLLIFETFKNVLRDLEVKLITCWFEADQEIASLACYLQCPVLSCDSDYFIYGCLYIPVDKMCYNKLYMDHSQSSAPFYMKCLVYDINNFGNQFGDKSLLPFLAALQGNDYVNAEVFKNFFKHISISSSKTGYNQSKLISVIDWLKSETVESAKSNIMKHIKKTDASRALRALNLTIDSYKIITPTTLHQLKLASSEINKNNLNFKKSSNLLKLPEEFVQRYIKNQIPSFVLDMLNFQKYCPGVQVENYFHSSSHCISFPIISGIYYIVRNLVGIKNKLTIELKMCGKLTKITLNCDTDYFETFDVYSVMFGPIDMRVSFIYKVLSFNESDIVCLELYDKNWKVLAMSLLYWLKNSAEEVNETHFHSILLMVMANFLQTSVGYYKSYSNFMHCKAGILNKLSKESVNSRETSNSMLSMLESISELECLNFTKKFIKLRKVEPNILENGYYIQSLHVFAMFQSVLYHVMGLNEMLDFPYPKAYVHKIYSGTLAYNISLYLNKKKNVTDFIHRLLGTEPNILRVYNFLVDTFVVYIPKENKVEKLMRTVTPQKSRKGGRSGKSNRK